MDEPITFDDDASIIDADASAAETVSKPTTAAKPWPEDATDFLSHQQDHSKSFCAGLFGYLCHVLSSPRRFLSVQQNALLYSYMSPVLRVGAANHKQRKALRKHSSRRQPDDAATVKELSKADLYTVPPSMEAQRLADLFWSARRSHPENSAPSAWSFLRILWIIARPTYLPGAYWQFITVLCQCSLPLLVRQVLLQLEEHPFEPFRKQGLSLAFAIFAVSLLQGVGDERQKFLAFRTGITLRSAVVSAAHAHLLNMTPRGRVGLTSGEITNLIAVDAQKLFELAQEGHYSWACPLAMVIVSVLLLLELGPAAIVGIVTMFLIVPMVQSIVRKMMSIRKHRVGAADKRIEIISSMLQGIRFTKLNRYEGRFMERVMEHRSVETRLLRKELFFLSLTLFATVISPVLASCLTFIAYALMDEENVLTTSLTFTSIFLFAALRFPINYAGKFMGKAAQGFQACYRFSAFFARESVVDAALLQNETVVPIREIFDNETMDMSQTTEECSHHVLNGKEEDLSTLIHVKASFCADESIEGAFTLHNIEMTVKRSQIMCVVGPVASGKSTLVQGLIGDILPMPTSKQDSVFAVDGKVSYASQIPFILNATVRDNILFGEPFDQELYDRVLEACCLKADIQQFHSGDLTEIGERGVTLSGGQKQRLSLARVAYSRPDIAILDDPLSALDAGTGKQVFEKLFKPTTPGLFSNTAVVLVTHASHFLKRVDSLLVLVNGRSVFVGEWDDLVSCHPTDPNELDAIESIRSSVQEEHSSESGAANSPIPTSQQVSLDATDRGNAVELDQEKGRIMTQEERKYGLSQMSTWISWFSYAGGWTFFIVFVITMTLDRYLYVAIELWIGESYSFTNASSYVVTVSLTGNTVFTHTAVWTQGAYDSVYKLGRWYPPQTDGISAQLEYITTLSIIIILSMIFTLIRTNWLIQGGARGASRLFSDMISKLLYAPMYYFDTTPVGRLMNRFTYDTETLDVTLTMNMTVLMTSLGWIFTGIILMAIILPLQLIPIIFVTVVYWILVLHYRKSAVDLQRLDATSRSPVQAQLGEVVDGTSTIRTFGKSSYFSDQFRKSLNENSGMMMNFMAAHRWLSVRIQLLGACTVLFAVSFVASFNDVLQINPGIAAILIIWSANFTIALSFFVQGISESEAAMTSLERAIAMTEIPQEESKSLEYQPVDPTWPATGNMVFDNVALRYRPGLPLSLDGLSFALKSGQRCGVVGRTGAGKSTLAAALFRLVELEGGNITLDGVDLSTIQLADVRGRQNGMSIIPQEPVLFPGTLKTCLDPFGDFTDEELMDALDAVRGASRGLNNLNTMVEEGGRNFSVGERQLICLGRAMLAKPKLLFLDEATASVDGETDALIQKMLRSRFVGTTLITIAHRLNTIMDYDCILVMSDGKAAEFGTPAELLSNKDGLFSELVESTGKESSAALRAIVFGSADV
jgi:ABC-type multidrug transport system fused ATPase/permease subunit